MQNRFRAGTLVERDKGPLCLFRAEGPGLPTSQSDNGDYRHSQTDDLYGHEKGPAKQISVLTSPVYTTLLKMQLIRTPEIAFMTLEYKRPFLSLDTKTSGETNFGPKITSQQHPMQL